MCTDCVNAPAAARLLTGQRARSCEADGHQVTHHVSLLLSSAENLTVKQPGLFSKGGPNKLEF